MLNPPVNIHGFFKAFECFSSTFQGKFYFQGLFKTVQYIQVFFKSVRTLCLAGRYYHINNLANSEDPDEMPQKVAFHPGLYCLLR